MDEYNQGWDPEVRQYFRKIMNSFAMGLLWLMTFVVAGLYFGLAIIRDGLRWYNLVFYGVILVMLALVLRFFYRVWRKKAD